MTFSPFFVAKFLFRKPHHLSLILWFGALIYLNLFNKLLTAYTHSRMILNVDGSR